MTEKIGNVMLTLGGRCENIAPFAFPVFCVDFESELIAIPWRERTYLHLRSETTGGRRMSFITHMDTGQKNSKNKIVSFFGAHSSGAISWWLSHLEKFFRVCF